MGSPASAYKGGCYADANGNCYYAPLSLATGDHSSADEAACGTTPDQHFAYFVTDDDNAPEFRIMDFPTLKAQALWACQRESNGMRGLDALYAVQRAGGYTFDQANAITSAGDAVYCPWNVQRGPVPPPPPPGL